jgi:hypothetical protein
VALRAEQLTALADTLGVSADFLLDCERGSPRDTGLSGKAKRLFAAVSHLPRHQQKKIFVVLEPSVAQHTRAAAGKE